MIRRIFTIKKATTIFFLFVSLSIHGQSQKIESFTTLPAQTSIDYFDIKAGIDNLNTGLIGIHYTLNLVPIRHFYTGFGLYSAIVGNNGGFYVFGFENNYRPQLYKSLYLESGFFIGGGGAHSHEVGGGLLLLPHIGLSYQIAFARFSVSYSYVTFPNGVISASEVLAGIIFPSDFDFFAPSDLSDNHDPIHWQEDRLYVSPILEVYYPTENDVSNPQNKYLGLVGGEGGKFFSNNRTYVALRTTAVAYGVNGNGYMSLMGGIGYQYPLTQHFYFTNDLFLGDGGGGNLNTGGGFLVEADTGFAWQLFPCLSPKITVGYLFAPDGHFATWVGTLGFNYNLGWISPANHSQVLHYVTSEDNIQHWRVIFFNQTLLHPQRYDYSAAAINLMGVNLEQQLNASWFMRYGASFAYAGQRSGGLAIGEIGPGYQFNCLGRVHPHFAVLAGAAGGGDVDTGGGFIVEPEVGLRFDIGRMMGLDTSVGQMMSVGGGHFNTTVVNIGAVFSFGELVKKPQ